jgi:hypothetical protein
MRVRFHKKGGGLDLRETFHGPRGQFKIFDNTACTQDVSGGLGADLTFWRLKKFFWRHV